MYKKNLELLSDFYEFTMSNGYLNNGLDKTIAYFDIFFRKTPDNGGYVIFAGLEQIIEYINNLKFDNSDISYLRSLNMFSNNFLEYLKSFKFTGDVWAVPEGTVVFPNEPLVTIRAPIIEAQLLETILLLNINHQSLIATKTRRIVNQAKGRPILEFGARRAHGADAAIMGARASIIGGAIGTSCTLSAKNFNVPTSGTMAHSWVQLFDSEYEAFKAYAETYPDNCTLLVDTYSTLNSGLKNAIKVFNEVIVPKGYRPKGIRLDSGDLAYLSKQARQILDEAGFSDCKIIASNSLDENLIKSLLLQGAKIDIFGVGENLITSKSDPILGGIYKLVAIENNNMIIPKIKVSENALKITNPGYKKVYRFYNKFSGVAIADLLTLNDEEIPKNEYTLFDSENPWKKKTISSYIVKELQVPIFKNGKQIYTCPTLTEIAKYSKLELDTMWEEVKRLENPHEYWVDLSEKLWGLKNEMLKNIMP